MKRKAPYIIVLFLLMLPSVKSLTSTVEASPATVRVPQDFPTIQQAIDASSSGDTILVAAGTYHESITVWRPLTVKGENRDSTIVDQPGALAVCHITSNNVFISGFTLQSGSIGLWNDNANGTTVTANTITSNDDGMWVTGSTDIIISDNRIVENLFMGVYLNGVEITTLSQNTIANNTYGIYLEISEHDSISGNTISSNYGDGIHVTNSNYNTVFRNMIVSNSVGIYLEGSSSNSIFENNIMNNLEQAWAETSTANNWDNNSYGNHWSDYAGVDLNGDGIGDTPYVVNQNNQDRYPLMNQWTNVALTSIVPSKNVVGEGKTVSMNVSVENQGWSILTTNITLYANTTVIATFPNRMLPARSYSILTFPWQTGSFALGSYNITARVDPVIGDTNAGDDRFVYYRIFVTIPGDLNGDGTVDIYDAIVMSGAYGAGPNSSNWNGNADINSDDVVDIFDAIILSGNYGKSS